MKSPPAPIEPGPHQERRDQQAAERDEVATAPGVETRPDMEDRPGQEAAAEEVRGWRLADEGRRDRRDVEVPGRIAAERPSGWDPVRRNGRRVVALRRHVAKQPELTGDDGIDPRSDDQPAGQDHGHHGDRAEVDRPRKAQSHVPIPEDDRSSDGDAREGRPEQQEDLRVGQERCNCRGNGNDQRAARSIRHRPVRRPDAEQGEDEAERLRPVVEELRLEAHGGEQQARPENRHPARQPATQQECREGDRRHEDRDAVPGERDEEVSWEQIQGGGGVGRRGQVISRERPLPAPFGDRRGDCAPFGDGARDRHVVPGRRGLRQKVVAHRGSRRHHDGHADDDQPGGSRQPPAPPASPAAKQSTEIDANGRVRDRGDDRHGESCQERPGPQDSESSQQGAGAGDDQ